MISIADPIQYARYGANNTWRDVTRYIQEMKLYQPYGVLNECLGGDPLFGVPKRLLISFTGVATMIELKEGDEFIITKTSLSTFQESPYFFHKYLLGVANPDQPIEYLQVDTTQINPEKKMFLHIHCHNVARLFLFDDIIDEYQSSYNIVVTYSEGTVSMDKEDKLSFLKIKNKGADIGGKLSLIHYLYINDIAFDYIFFVHSKTDPVDFKNFLQPFRGRKELIDCIVRDKSKTIGAIFPNYNNITFNTTTNSHSVDHIDVYMKDILHYLGIPFSLPSGDNFDWFNGTNTFIFSKTLVDSIFKNSTLVLYNALNENNSYDYLWHKLKYGMPGNSMTENYKRYNDSHHCGNAFHETHETFRNACVEHVFERIWIYAIKHCQQNYLCLPSENICQFYNIRFHAIYFPQFHDSKENNEFWGHGFTEWSLLAPYYDEITIRNNTIPMMKPHDSIGYYSLDDINVFHNQRRLAKEYGINGFVIYHYWFGNGRRVLHKVEDHLLEEEENDFPFCFSWANEPWTKNWDGSDQGQLIDQDYEDDDNEQHILYLVQFFKKKNYIKTASGECLFYIYNYIHMEHKFESIVRKWTRVLDAHGLRIKIITTKNADPRNHTVGTDIKYEFLPLCQSNVWETYQGNDLLSGGQKMGHILYHYEINYNRLIEEYNSSESKDSYHLGVPLSWNNIVRKKNMPHLHTLNFNRKNFERMLLLVVSKIVLRSINRYTSSSIPKYKIQSTGTVDPECQYHLDDNIIIINAWNEWNEQAVLEPNNVTNFENLQTIHDMMTSL